MYSKRNHLCVLSVYFFSFDVVFCYCKGFKLGAEKHTTEIFLEKSGALQVTSGIEGLAVLKTTKVTSISFEILYRLFLVFPPLRCSDTRWTNIKPLYISLKLNVVSELQTAELKCAFDFCWVNNLQSGFEGFIRDKYTMLPETRERMLATEITALWR